MSEKSPRKRWRYYELSPGEVSRAVKIRCSVQAADWFAGLTAAERGQLIERWHNEVQSVEGRTSETTATLDAAAPLDCT